MATKKLQVIGQLAGTLPTVTAQDNNKVLAVVDGEWRAVEPASSPGASVYNAETHYDFPSIGDVNVIYKAESERLLYQWNADELRYDILSESEISVDGSSIEIINGGNAYGTT